MTSLHQVGQFPGARVAWGVGMTVALALGWLVLALTPPRNASAIVPLPGERSVGSPLDRLILEEQFTSAFAHAVAELEDRAGRNGALAEPTLRGLVGVGIVAHLAGDQRTADDVLSAALAADDGEWMTPAVRAEALTYLGRVARYKRERKRAWSLYELAARELAQGSGALDDLRANLEQALADWTRPVDPDAAIRRYRAALELRRRTSRSSFGEADNRVWLGWVMARSGMMDQARSEFARARRILDTLGVPAHSLTATIDNALADLLAIDSDWEAAGLRYEQTAETMSARRIGYPGGYARRVLPLDGYTGLAVTELKQGRGEEAWRHFEAGRAGIHVDLATIGLWRTLEPQSYPEIRSLRRSLLAIEQQRSESSGGGAPLWSENSWPVFSEALELRARIMARETAYLARHRPSVPDIDRVRRNLAPRTALVGWLLFDLGRGPAGTGMAQYSTAWAYVLRNDRPLQWVSLWSGEHPDQAAERRGAPLGWWARLERAASWPTRVLRDPELTEELRSWHGTLFAPLSPLLDGVDRLIVDGSDYPIELLVDEQGRYLVDRFEVTYVPSAMAFDLFAVAREPLPSRAPRSLVAIARSATRPQSAPGLQGDFGDSEAVIIRGTRSAFDRNTTAVAELPGLLFARAEAEAIVSQFEDAVILDGPPGLRFDREASSPEAIHIASHTLVDGAPERCALVLGDEKSKDDGLLEVDEILLGWEIDARLTTLSGCETARAAGASRGELLGFTPALLAAGSRSILASLWPVDDRATALLMTRFYSNLTNGAMPTAGALREAKQYVREFEDDAGRRPFEHPAYWGGFLLTDAGG